jgi:hypothetical protein
VDGLNQINIGKDGECLAKVNGSVYDISGFLLSAEIDDNLEGSLHFMNGKGTCVSYSLP